MTTFILSLSPLLVGPVQWTARARALSPTVPWIRFQVLLTRLSTFFSTFLHSTSPLSVFVLYLDLAEIYLLVCAEITINATLEQGMIWKTLRAQGTLTLSGVAFLPTLARIVPASPLFKRSIGRNALQHAPLFLWSFGSSFATTGPITFVFFSSA